MIVLFLLLLLLLLLLPLPLLLLLLLLLLRQLLRLRLLLLQGQPVSPGGARYSSNITAAATAALLLLLPVLLPLLLLLLLGLTRAAAAAEFPSSGVEKVALCGVQEQQVSPGNPNPNTNPLHPNLTFNPCDTIRARRSLLRSGIEKVVLWVQGQQVSSGKN